MLFNFSGLDFTTASNLGRLFGVRFAPTNDSFAPNIGLYGNVKATSVTNINSGFDSLLAYNEHVANYCPPGQNCGASLGDLPANTPYFNQNQSLNAIASGEFLTGITYVSYSELLASGYNPNWSSGAHTIAFKFDKSAICDRGECKAVPEPTSAIGILGLGVLAIASGWKRKQNSTSDISSNALTQTNPVSGLDRRQLCDRS